MIVAIGDQTFRTKTAATEHFRRMLYWYGIGEVIPEPDHSQLRSLLAKHSECAEKIGVGVKSFSVRWADYNTRCFEVVRVDGSRIDFSFRWCLRKQEH
jgi:hypothetical protein